MKKQTSTRGFAVLSMASLICKVLSFVYLPIQAMLVHDGGNGVISAGLKLYILIYSLSNAGLPVIISKFVSERVEIGDFRGSRTVFKNAFILMLGLGIVATLFTFFGSGFLADWCGMVEAKLMFMFIAPTFLFTAVSCSMRGYFQGRHYMTPTAVSQIIEQIINSALTAILEIAFFNYAQRIGQDSITYTAAGSAVGTALAAAGAAGYLVFIFLLIYRKQRIREYTTQNYTGETIQTITVYKQLIRFSIPAIISCIAASATDIIDTKSCIPLLLAGHFTQSEAYALFGIYSTKYQRLLTLPVIFVSPLVTAMIPALAAARARGDKAGFHSQIEESFKLNFLVVFPIVAGLTFLAKPIITVIFLSQNDGALFVIAGTWMAILITIQSVQSGVLFALDKPLIAPLTLIAGMVIKIIVNYLLIPIHSINIYGALVGNAIAWAIAIALNTMFIRHHMPMKLRTWPAMLKPGLASLLMGALCLGIFTVGNSIFSILQFGTIAANDIAIAITIPLGATLYFAMLILSGSLQKDDLSKLPMGAYINKVCRRIPMLKAALDK